MRNLELRDIAGYLPYELRAITTKTTFSIPVIAGIVDYVDIKDNEVSYTTDEGYYLCKPEELKPYLHPMSDLIKPILSDGKIPLMELAKIITKEGSAIPVRVDTDNKGVFYCTFSNGCLFSYTTGIGVLALWQENGDLPIAPTHQHELFDKLHEWHFDYRGLIEAGLAVDVNTINTSKT